MRYVNRDFVGEEGSTIIVYIQLRVSSILTFKVKLEGTLNTVRIGAINSDQ